MTTKKAVILPGVGFHKNKEKYENFCSSLKNNVDFNLETEVFYWTHEMPLPEIELPWKSSREWIYEVILDFQQVIKHALKMQIPYADYYIGHSAGSIISLTQKETPCVIFGSPAILVEIIHNGVLSKDMNNEELFFRIGNYSRPVYNIINKYDQLAYYLDYPNVENEVYSNNFLSIKTYNPCLAHFDYWENKSVIKKIGKKINKWEHQKV